MNILHVIAEMGRGGAERIVLDLVGAGCTAGGRVAVASGGGAWVPSIEQRGGSHHHVGLAVPTGSATLRSALKLSSVIRRFRPDVIHTHNVRATIATRAAMHLARGSIPMITTFHGGVESENYSKAVRLLQRTTPLVVACAPAIGRSLVEAGYPKERLEVIRNGASLDPASAVRVQRMVDQHGLGSAPVVGLGRLVPQKGWRHLIGAATQLCDLDVEFVVAGEGPLRGELEALVVRSGAPVRFIGAVDDVAALLGAARAVVSSSLWEGLPISLMEAVSLGLPAVATTVDGVMDVFDDRTAVLVPPGDEHSLAAGLRRVLTDPAHADAISARGQAAAPQWSPLEMTRGYELQYSAATRRSESRRLIA